jgi:hypothetical protein
MKQHRYRITVEHIADQDGQAIAPPPSLQFEALNHDDILAVVERVRAKSDFDAQTATNLAVGLKLFGEVMLMNRDHPLFAELKPHFGDFMKRLKSGAAGRQAG